MKKYIILFTLLLTYATSAYSQFSINYSVGYGTYEMNEMKQMMKYLHHSVGMPELGIQIVDNFPSHITHQVELAYRIKRHETGYKFGFLSTGGRLSRADYSGSFLLDATLSAYKQELFYRFYAVNNPMQKGKFNLYLELTPALLLNRFTLESKMQVGNEREREKERYRGVNFSVTPSVGVSYNVTSMIALRLAAGYEMDFPKAVLKQGAQELRYSSNWTGLRVSAGISLFFQHL